MNASIVFWGFFLFFLVYAFIQGAYMMAFVLSFIAHRHSAAALC